MIISAESQLPDNPIESGRAALRATDVIVEVSEDLWPTIIEHCGFDYMKAHANKVAPLGGAVFEGGASDFMNKGVNGRWRDTLSEAESNAYEQMAVEKLGPECARWLATGKLD